MARQESISPVRLLTASFPVGDRLSMRREIYGRHIVHGDIEPIDDRPFPASVLIPDLREAMTGAGGAVLFPPPIRSRRRCAATAPT